MPITLEPIGEVRNKISQPMRQGWGEVVSELVLKPELEEALEGLEQFSHIIVVFWMHKAPLYHPTKIHLQGRQDLPLVGLFATRSPHRPNPVGVSVVELLERHRNILKVKGLDALNGTPVIDIKPYLPGDKVGEARTPKWVREL